MVAGSYDLVAIVSIIVAGIAAKITCAPVKTSLITRCDHPLHQNITYPAIFGQLEIEATGIIARILPLIPEVDRECAHAMRSFLCAIYAPPSDPSTGVAVSPCRHVCQAAARCQKQMTGRGIDWKDEWNCARFPQDSELCVHYKGLNQDGNVAKNTTDIVAPSSLQSSKTRADIKPRRYDVTDKGSTRLFRGWVDVQGQGAANDYCRVIGGGNRRKQFLACTLAGSTDDAVLYVSKRGFDAGHRESWFMRDMDRDGRDDYCRCVGRGVRSKIYCMKAGLLGFYGGLLQPGSEYTFVVKTPGPCLDKTINPFIGIR